jgi:hypothetical protein
MAGTFPFSKGVMRMRSPCCLRSDRSGTPLAVHPLKPLLIVPVLMPATMPSNLFNAPIHDVIDCQDGDHTGVLRSDSATPSELPENIHVFMTNFQDHKAEEVKV